MRLLAFLFFSSARASGLRATAAVAPGGGDPDLATIEARLRASYITTGNVSGLDADVRSFLPLIAPPGQFTDLNYTTGKPTGWGGYDHCLRFSEMASALFSPASAFFNSAALAFFTMFLNKVWMDTAISTFILIVMNLYFVNSFILGIKTDPKTVTILLSAPTV